MTSRYVKLANQFGKLVGTEHAVFDRNLNALCVFPASTSEVAEVVRTARELGAVVQSFGKRRFPHPLSLRAASVLVSLDRMRQVTRLDEHSLIVVTQTGLTGRDLESMLNRRGLTLGGFPDVMLDSTIGGLLSVRSSGKCSPALGMFQDALLGISVVLPDGRVIHTKTTPSHATGPDVARLFCGSMGAFGIICSASIRVRRAPVTTLSMAFSFATPEAAINAVRMALHEEAQPELVEMNIDWNKPEFPVEVHVRFSGNADLAACDRDLFASAASTEGGQASEEQFKEIALDTIGWRSYFANASCLTKAVSLLAEARVSCLLSRVDLVGAQLSISPQAAEQWSEKLLGIDGVSLDVAEDPVAPYTELLKAELDEQRVFALPLLEAHHAGEDHDSH